MKTIQDAITEWLKLKPSATLKDSDITYRLGAYVTNPHTAGNTTGDFIIYEKRGEIGILKKLPDNWSELLKQITKANPES